jgi:hypothetical protein
VDGRSFFFYVMLVLEISSADHIQPRGRDPCGFFVCLGRGTAKVTACSDATARGAGVAAGRESVQRRETSNDVHTSEGASEAGSMDQRRRLCGPKGRHNNS